VSFVKTFLNKILGGRQQLKDEVFLHDSNTNKPHDLDDSFHDADIQRRVGKLIASSITRQRT